MTFLEAVRFLDHQREEAKNAGYPAPPEKWAMPAGGGKALVLDRDGCFISVPYDLRGPRSSHMPNVKDILDEWLIVDPSVVNAQW